MHRGDFAAAWAISDRILRERILRAESSSRWPRHLQYIWHGESLRDRRVLVRCYHGLGDTIQFVRLLERLREHAAHTILWAQPALIDLLASVRGIDECLPLHDGTPECTYDVDIELMELAHYLRIEPDTAARRIPYIYEDVPRHQRRNSHVLNVGIAWTSGPWNPARSISDTLISRLDGIPGIRWHSLQYEVDCPFPVEPMVDKSLALTAQRMLQLDLVISVDTLTAHLAGALALPVWTLLPRNCDWRWRASGTQSCWYPTMRLFRQPTEGDWSSVVDEVHARLLRARGRLGTVDCSQKPRVQGLT
jgi:hypothetical protein